MASTTHRRYAEIFRDVEALIDNHIAHQTAKKHHRLSSLALYTPHRSKLKLLVPSIGTFFTPLPLQDAFAYQDSVRFISSRRFVAPSFNDVRLILNTAQLMSLVRGGSLELMTFDGDGTLYGDGASLSDDNPVISRIIELMGQGTKIGIVTAAGYTDASRYYDRLHGLLDALAISDLSPSLKQNLLIMGGESNFLFKFNESEPSRLTYLPRREWIVEEMHSWRKEDITELLDVAEGALRDCVSSMRLDAEILRKERAVGIVPAGKRKFTREQLEETVLVTQKILARGNDVFVDIGDKSWGVVVCQRYFGGILPCKSLHVGDQFLSAGANDFKARLASTTAWITSPEETVQLLDELLELHANTEAAASSLDDGGAVP